MGGGSQPGGGGGRRDLSKGVAIAFSGFLDDEAKRLKGVVTTKLKGRVEGTSDVRSCTHVVVFRPCKRTIKLCVAISHPSVCLVSDAWIKACESAKSFVDTKPYELSGDVSSVAAKGPQWSFNVGASRKRAADGRCLEGHAFYVTPCEKPVSRFGDADIKLIIEASGGALLDGIPSAGGPAAVVISTAEERKSWERLARHRNVTILNASHLLTCVLRQELDLSAGRLA